MIQVSQYLIGNASLANGTARIFVVSKFKFATPLKPANIIWNKLLLTTVLPVSLFEDFI